MDPSDHDDEAVRDVVPSGNAGHVCALDTVAGSRRVGLDAAHGCDSRLHAAPLVLCVPDTLRAVAAFSR